MRKLLVAFVLALTCIGSFAKDFKGAEIQSKKAFHFGRFETRFFSSSVSGMLSTFFLYENQSHQTCGDCKWQEIDIEVFGKGSGNTWQSNPIYQTKGDGDRIVAEDVHELEGGKFVDDWHTYTLDWTPDYIKWYVDDKLIRTFTDSVALKHIGRKPMLAMFNIWTSKWTDWTGPFDPKTATPTYQLVDYIKVYDYISDTTFSEKPTFEDNFDKDFSKWNISQHSFDGNLCDFDKDNVELRDGNLIMAFTKDGKQGIPRKLDLNGGIDVSSSDWSELREYPYLLEDELKNMYIYEDGKITFYDQKGKYVDRKIIKNGAVDTSELKSGWYYFVISDKPKILRKIQKE